jgi:hypothetical protein
MDGDEAELNLQVSIEADGEAVEVAEAALQLRRELLELDVNAVEALRAGAPLPGTKGVDVAVAGALLVSLTDPQVLVPVVEAVRSWLAGSFRRSVKMELGGDVLELTGVSSAEQRRLADEWLARHAAAW